MEKLSLEVIANDEHKVVAYHFTNKKAQTVQLFVYDHKKNQKYIFDNENLEFSIQDISPCGKKIITITESYVNKERKTKIFDIASGEVLFDTNEFFGYEAIFTSIPNLIVVRAKIKSKSNKSFLYDIDKKEVVHIMKGEFCLIYAGENQNQEYVYPNSKKKDEIIILDMNTLEERNITLKEKCKIQTVLPLKSGCYLLINENMDAIKIDESGKIIWKTKLDFDEFYFAPECFEYKNEIIFNMYEHIRLNIETGEITESGIKVKGRLSKYLGDMAIPFGGDFEVINLKTREISYIDMDLLK